MSLHLGNLSPHIRRDELERVFRRFGPSNVRLKDGYGFVVYDLSENAEKALRALRGKHICGEPISLTWSNKQPRGMQRFTKGSRFYEPYPRRKFTGTDGYSTRERVSRDRQASTVPKHPNSEGRPLHMDDFHDKEIGNHGENIEGGEHHNSKESLLDETGASGPNLLETDRWGLPAGNPLNDNAVENGAHFDRYEPYHAYDKRDKDENQQMASSYASHARENGQEKERREHTQDATTKHPDNPKPQQVCYVCGRMGHKRRNCPLTDASRPEKFTRLHDASFRYRGEKEPKRLRPVSLRRRPSTGDRPFSGHHRKASGTLKMMGRTESSLVKKENRQYQLIRRESQRKRKRKEQGSPRNHHGRQRKRSSSAQCSDSTASSSSSHSQLPETNSCSRSPSTSSRTSSISTSSYSRSESSRSRSRSSSPTSLALSMSLNRRLPSSPTKTLMEATVTPLKGYLENDTSPDSKNCLIEQRQVVEGVSTSDNYRLDGTTATLKDDSFLPSFKVGDEINKDHSEQQEEIDHSRPREENGNDSTTKIHYEVKGRCMTPEKCSLAEENLPERNDFQKSGAPVRMSNPDVLVSSWIDSSTSISSQEAYMVLKHYGLKVPEENEKNLPVETYFGSARLWPWEVIYYRRLRKGPISTENYARRIAQNREFGIVDKYVRSSSGWSECESLLKF
ncbi:RNA recognition motif domain [Macleaya cordata]|uniref:RNA recognition motif domain n=1 Tax=Macleaya cordata TaxID=56857 RepID=A0A200Q7J5_MACCD|nr:RNA recognition motif domain [Macleaya cordata]